jgi:CO/xanthine dehydrogenase Mo-binding subunit
VRAWCASAGTVVHPDVDQAQVEGAALWELSMALDEPTTTTGAGPPIGNAIFAASEARMRHLPIRPDAVLKGMGGGPLAPVISIAMPQRSKHEYVDDQSIVS